MRFSPFAGRGFLLYTVSVKPNRLYFAYGMEDNTEQKKSNYAWLRPVLTFYGKITGWIVGPVVIAMLIGNKFLLIPAFLVSIYGIYREIKIYQKTLVVKETDGGK